MRYCTFRHGTRTAAGRLEGEAVVDLSDGGRWGDLGAYLQALDGGERVPDGPALPLSQIRLLAPVPRPPKIVAVGLNYAGHAAEQQKTPPSYPMFFAKARTCVVGPDDPIRLPEGRRYIDVEVEFAVVFGRRAQNVPASRAMEAIFGFTILNDVSDRKAQKDDKQFYRAKSWPTFAPTGPVVVTPDEIDLERARIELVRSGHPQQDADLSQLIFKVPQLVEMLSSFQEIEPGDLLATGTPSGVGVFRDPPVYLVPGDLVECRLEGIGVLRNPVV
ncbi:MAG: fumarylacetoacetate hydrolase family protein [Armatimonadetes bacterium]|nr:fumarylacetoacetate hydrolase family protein [Armatimonadota bacterium]